jgi:two-component system CheB/CheR fusion protein
LRAVVEQYETSQEELRAGNEELQSVNEELRSTLEELETSKEELQSMNEELQTANQENRHKVEDLSQLTSDLQNLMAATEIATLFLDRELRILRVTPRTRELFNIRASDRGRPFTELRHRLGYDQLEQDALRVLEKLAPIEREIRSEAGDWYLTRINPYRSSSDQIQGVVITFVEITKLKNAELAARDSEEKFRALVAASAQIVWTTDAEGNVVEDSPSWRAFTGQSFKRFRRSGGAGAVHPDDREAAMKKWRDSLASQTPFEAEFRIRHVSGQWRWTHARAVPLRDDSGKLRGWVGMNADVTERKATEFAQREAEAALREASRRKDEFLAMLGHELRNPLAPLRNALAIFDKRLPPDPELRRIRDISERQVLHLTRLVDELLDVARISSGRLQLKTKRVDLRDIINAAVTNRDSAIKGRGHELTLVLTPQPVDVEGDEVRLVQVVSNLLDNAAKYTPEHGRIRVTLNQEGHHAILSVADTGVGLAPEALTSVFDVFARVDPSGGNPVSGLGLGLTLVRRLVELHGGAVEAHSEGPGKGAIFVVRLPLTAAADAPGAASDEAPGSGPVAPRRILLVDDNRDALYSLKLLLEMEGHSVFKALDGQSALETAAREAPEVVVLDIGLPDMDGYELARRLRRLAATSKAVLIAATGFGREQDRARSAEAGIDYHLVKPVGMNSLRGLLRKTPARERGEQKRASDLKH